MNETNYQRRATPRGDATPPVRAATLPDYLTPDEAAAYCRRSRNALAILRSNKEGPPYVKHGNRILYPRRGLVAWLESGRP